MRYAIAVLLIVLAAACISNQREHQYNEYVSLVIDGDTVKTSTGAYVRLLGINAPEKGEFFYEEAKEKLSELVLGKEITLERDLVINKDKYDRLLRYLFVNDTSVSVELAKGGYARSFILENNLKYAKEILDAEKYAKNNKFGIWSE